MPLTSAGADAAPCQRSYASPSAAAGSRSSRSASIWNARKTRVSSVSNSWLNSDGARAQPRAHPLALGLADFAEPAVLQRRQRGEQHEQDRGRRQLPGNAAHDAHFTRKTAAGSRALHFLQNDCREITTSVEGASSYSSNEAVECFKEWTMQRLIVSLISLAMTLGGFAARVAGDTKAEQLLAQARAALGGDKQPRQGAGADGNRHLPARDAAIGS